jgi:hypothetical protein
MATGAAKPTPGSHAGGPQPAWQRLAPLAVAFALGVAAGCTLLGRAALAPSATHLLPHACHAPVPTAAHSGGSAALPERHANVTALYESYAHVLEGVVTARVFPEQGSCADLECRGVGPMDFAGRFGGGDWPPQGLTMVGTCRIWNIKEAIEHVVAAGVEGDFVELGAWRGGASLYARAMLNALGQGHRQVHVFDAWDALQQYILAKAYMAVPVARVEGYFAAFGLTEGTHFVKGLFKDTLPEWRAQHEGRKVAILRVDGNLYSSHQVSWRGWGRGWAPPLRRRDQQAMHARALTHSFTT